MDSFFLYFSCSNTSSYSKSEQIWLLLSGRAFPLWEWEGNSMEAKHKKCWSTGMREPRRKVEVEHLLIKKNIFSFRRVIQHRTPLRACFSENGETTVNFGVNERDFNSTVPLINCVTWALPCLDFLICKMGLIVCTIRIAVRIVF